MSERMKVFLSWSGPIANQVADGLQQLLREVFQDVDPWFSPRDIGAGARWSREISKKLSETDFGVVCLTSSNQRSEWILFESGALAKSVDESLLVPLLIGGLRSGDLKPPLGEFQSKPCDKQGVLGVLEAINARRTTPFEAADLAKKFEQWWPNFKSSFERLPEEPETQGDTDEARNIQLEILEEVRGLSRRLKGSGNPTTDWVRAAAAAYGQRRVRKLVGDIIPGWRLIAHDPDATDEERDAAFALIEESEKEIFEIISRADKTAINPHPESDG